MQNEEKNKSDTSVSKILREAFGSPRERIFDGAQPRSSSARMRAAIGYVIAATFIFAAIALLFTLISEARKFADEKTKPSAEIQPQANPIIIFTPKGSKVVPDKNGNLILQKNTQNLNESAAVKSLVEPSK